MDKQESIVVSRVVMNKKEAAEFLGKSTKTIQRLVSQNKLSVKYVDGHNGQIAIFDRAELERFKQDLETATVKGAIVTLDNHGQITKKEKNNYEQNGFDRFVQAVELGCQQDPFFQYELLQRAAENGWLIPSKQLAAILKISPKTLVKSKIKRFGGFVCSQEDKTDRIWWRVAANNQ
jgi:transposase